MTAAAGGALLASELRRQGVETLFALCGGHISPILVSCKAAGLRVIDVRDEANAVFAADATSRLTGIPGVAAVTAGPGVTNALTALQNASLAESPLVLLGGATATMLKGRGSLQDIDQLSAVRPHVKWARAVRRVRDLVPCLQEAFERARSGVPGPVFLECPLDLLYGEEVVRAWYVDSVKGAGVGTRAVRWYLGRHVDRLFSGAGRPPAGASSASAAVEPSGLLVRGARALLERAQRPVLVVGSQALTRPREAAAVAEAVERLGVPVYLAGMARGLLGQGHRLQLRHKRGEALREADLVLLAGVPNDFRLAYGRAINRRARVVTANLSWRTLVKNRLPTLPLRCDPGRFLQALAARPPARTWSDWLEVLRGRDDARDQEIAAMAAASAPPVNPLAVCRAIEGALDDDSVIVADGGDFVASAAYVLAPRGPLRWLDPGVFGTLGVGAGFALAAAACRPTAEVWLIYGDGAAGFSLVELDTFARHGLGVIAVVGNDAGWTQIARDQVSLLGDDVGTVLARTDYERAAEGLGAVGLRVERLEQLEPALRRAKQEARAGRPVLVNVHVGRTAFRQGSISI